MQTDVKFPYDINDRWENIDWNEKFKLSFDSFFNDRDVNPWKLKDKNECIKKYLSGKYIKNDPNFSWIFPWDKKLLSSSSVSQNFGMPTQISGNFENANLYLCLFNPSIPNKDANSSENKDIDLKTYIDNGYEDAISKEEYERAKNNNNEFVIDIWHKNNVVYDELEHIISLIQKDHNKDALSVIENIKEKKHWPKKDKDKGYYIYTYYDVLLKDQLINLAKKFPCGDSPDFDKINFNDVEEELKPLENLKICNVELFPYRDDKQGRINLKKDNSVIDISVVRFIILLILKRIYDYKNNNKEKPTFIVRTWTNKKQCGYFDAIKEFFEKIDSSNADHDIENIKNYFLVTRSQQNGKIKNTNLMSIADYEKIQKIKDNCLRDMSGIIDKIQQSI